MSIKLNEIRKATRMRCTPLSQASHSANYSPQSVISANIMYLYRYVLIENLLDKFIAIVRRAHRQKFSHSSLCFRCSALDCAFLPLRVESRMPSDRMQISQLIKNTKSKFYVQLFRFFHAMHDLVVVRATNSRNSNFEW